MQTRNRRCSMILAIVMVTVTYFTYFFIAETGVVKGANAEVDKKVEQDQENEESKILYEGIIYDINDYQITAKNEDGSVSCLYPVAYNFIGYSSPIYGQNGLRDRYKDTLFNEEGKEAGLYLTTDTNLQQFCYDLMYDKKGSIVVFNNDDGSVKAMVNKPDEIMDYDVNSIEDNYSKYSKINGFFINQALYEDTPGSVFKMVTSTSLYENDLGDFTFYDTGEYNGVVNAGYAAYGNLDINSGIVNSVNTFFAAAADKLGAKNLENTAKEFLIGQDIELDFGIDYSNFDLEYYQNKRLIEDSGYGQGKTLISPIHMGMIMSCIVTGEMNKPYIVRKISVNGKDKYVGKSEVLKDDYNETALQSVKENLHNVAIDYGLDEDTYGNVYAKTGTAENDNGDPPHIYLVVANETYTIVISVDDSEQSSHSLIPTAADILQYLSENVDGENYQE